MSVYPDSRTFLPPQAAKAAAKKSECRVREKRVGDKLSRKIQRSLVALFAYCDCLCEKRGLWADRGTTYWRRGGGRGRVGATWESTAGLPWPVADAPRAKRPGWRRTRMHSAFVTNGTGRKALGKSSLLRINQRRRYLRTRQGTHRQRQ